MNGLWRAGLLEAHDLHDLVQVIEVVIGAENELVIKRETAAVS